MARYFLWGWLLGGPIGALTGFYALLLLLAMGWPDMTYEDGLGYLLIGAGAGLLAGGYVLSRFLKRRTHRQDAET